MSKTELLTEYAPTQTKNRIEGEKDMIGDRQHAYPQADQRYVEHEQQDVADPEAHHQAPEHVGALAEHGRPWIDAVDEQDPEDERQRRTAGDAKRERRDEGGLVGRIVGRLGCHDTFDGALAEPFGVRARCAFPPHRT